MPRSVLILGPTGRMGRNATAAFAAADWSVTPFVRTSGDLMADARGKDVIVNAWNPPYQDWAHQLPDLTARVQAAAVRRSRFAERRWYFFCERFFCDF